MPQAILQNPVSYSAASSEILPSRASVAITLQQSVEASIFDGEDALAVEEPLEIQLAYGPQDRRTVKSISVTMRTPGDDAALAAGFLKTEGVVQEPEDIVSIHYAAATELAVAVDRAVLSPDSAGNILRVELDECVEPNIASLERNFYTTSSCGICGKASLLALQAVGPPRVHNSFTVPADTIYKLQEKLNAAQTVFRSTGGLHGAGLFDCDGELQDVSEDVGRHNAVDKLLGKAFLEDRLPLRDLLLMLSGRASFELLQKAVMAGIPMVVAVGAPSSLAVSVARQFDITLVGFLRGRRFNIYHGAQRVTAGAKP
jgi:FdhD protein